MEVVSLITKQLLKPFKKDQKILKEETYKHCLYSEDLHRFLFGLRTSF